MDIMQIDEPHVGQRGIGSTSCKLKNKLYVVGGENNSDLGKFLRLSCYNLGKECWDKIYFNTSSIMNRVHCCSVAFGDEYIFVFGGFSNAQLSEVSHELIVLKENENGLVASKSHFHECAARAGQVAISVGREKKSVLLIGGAIPVTGNNHDGSTHTKMSFSTEAWLWFRPDVSNLESEASWPRRVEFTVDDEPSGRAFHAACVCDDAGELILVSGGRSQGGLLHDLWLLDISAVLASEEVVLAGGAVVADKNQKKGGKQKGAGNVPTARWIPITVSTSTIITPRQMHSIRFEKIEHEGDHGPHKPLLTGNVYIYGGVDVSGVPITEPSVLRLTAYGDDKVERVEVMDLNTVNNADEEEV